MHAHKYPAWPFFLGGLLVLLLTGCSTRLGDNIKIPMGELALYESTPKAKSIAHLQENIKVAKKDNMPFLAPHYFREASDILNTAQQSSPDKVSTDQLAKADALLDRGEAVMKIVIDRLGKELELKRKLDDLKANEIYPRQYKINIDELSNLIEKVELGRAGNIENDKDELNKNMQELHIKTVQYTSLHQSQTIDYGTKNKDDEK